MTRTSGGPDFGFVAAGIATFFAGWVPSVGVGLALMRSSGSCDRDAGGLFIVPVGGPIGGLAVADGNRCPSVEAGLWALGIADAFLQTTGVVLFIAGLAANTQRTSVGQRVRVDVGLGHAQVTLGF